MQTLWFDHVDYGALRFGVFLHLLDRQAPELRASIWAEGVTRTRGRWRRDFIEWCTQHGLKPAVPVGGKRRRDSSEFAVHLTSWAHITEFMIRWVGIQRMIDAVHGADGMRMVIGEDVRRLQRQVQQIAELVIEMRTEAREADARLNAAASALLGEPSSKDGGTVAQ